MLKIPGKRQTLTVLAVEVGRPEWAPDCAGGDAAVPVNVKFL